VRGVEWFLDQPERLAAARAAGAAEARDPNWIHAAPRHRAAWLSAFELTPPERS
jgi:hypothetical protein